MSLSFCGSFIVLKVSLNPNQPFPLLQEVGATQWRRGRTGAAGTGLRERAEWAEPGSVTDSYWPRCVAVAGRRRVDAGMSRSRH